MQTSIYLGNDFHADAAAHSNVGAKTRAFEHSFFGWALQSLQPIAIDRNKQHSVRQLIQAGRQALAAGKWVIIFPEGTRVAPHQSRKYSKSGTALGIATGYPIIPIAHNAGHCWPKNGFLKRAGIISVVIGSPIEISADLHVHVHQLNQQIERWIETTSNAL